MHVVVAATDDSELMRRIAQGEEPALGELYDRYGRLVMSVALAVAGERATAEEVTLDVFLSAWQHAGSYDPALAKVPTWLTRLARNRAIDRLRREAVRPAGHSVALNDAAPVGRALGDVDAAVDLSLTQQRVRAAVASLPADQRQALALAFFQGYTHSEIAGLLDQSLGTVKGHIRGGMNRLRLLLETDPARPSANGANPAGGGHNA
ncbi:MAG: sigma-70 family RNA polymerase sigma factor [Candidatus Promineofilum sp.]|nr:sigma-70 family RNA polymerase sigma factor [Promineifilum sp.]